MRYLSLMLRRRHSQKECMRTLHSFEQWREAQLQLRAPRPRARTLLLVRLDDIGDYLLFRNQLAVYKRSARWGGHSITLLGNSSWKELFTCFDSDAVDDAMWVKKGEYLTSAPYRNQIWAQLRERGFDTVIAPSRTRPLLLDDLCRLAAAPAHSIGCVNTHVHAGWNDLSDRLYGELFMPPDAWVHEFDFNGQFAAWAGGARFAGSRPILDAPLLPVAGAAASGSGAGSGASVGSELICFVGANTRSRRWPASRWIEFINLYERSHAGRVVLAGSGSAERELAAQILRRTNAQSIVGTVSLLELVRWIRGARAVVSNDTMGAHLGVSCDRPTVIVANGVNHQRFTDYDKAGITGVATLYPRVFARRRERMPGVYYTYADALTSDVASIAAGEVLAGLAEVLRTSRPALPA